MMKMRWLWIGVLIGSLTGTLRAQDLQITANVQVGSYPRGMAVTPDGAKGYVPDLVSGVVSVIDLKAQSILKSISVGSGARNPVVSPDGRHVYVLTSPGRVVVLEVARDVVIGAISVPTPPSNIAFSTDGTKAVMYVLSAGSANYMTVVDTATFTVTAQMPMPATTFYNGFAISPDNRYIFATTSNTQDADDFVSVVDLATLAVVRKIVVGNMPVSIAFGAGGAKAYVANYGSSSVSVLDVASLSMAATIPMSSRPFRMSPGRGASARYVWAVGAQVEGVGVIDSRTDSLVSTIGVAGITVPMNEISFRADGRVGVVTAASSGTVNLIDANDAKPTFATVLKSIATGGRVTSVVSAPVDDMAYVVDERYGRILFCAIPGGKDMTLEAAIMAVLAELKAYVAAGGLTKDQNRDAGRSISDLEGRRDGQASNGALEKLHAGSLHDALVKVEHSMKNMQGLPRLDVNKLQKMLAEGSRTDTRKALEGSGDATALGYFNAGVQAMEGGDYLQAVRNFRKALGD